MLHRRNFFNGKWCISESNESERYFIVSSFGSPTARKIDEASQGGPRLTLTGRAERAELVQPEEETGPDSSFQNHKLH